MGMVNVISLNVNGLLSPAKHNMDIAFLQETHMTARELELMRKITHIEEIYTQEIQKKLIYTR